MSREETHNIRDQRISEQHRKWGVNVPGVDVDFLLLEYDRGRAVALIEYKHERGQHVDPDSPTGRALIDLTRRAGLPLYSVRYADDFAWLELLPLNAAAIWKLTGEHSAYDYHRFDQYRIRLSEAEYVQFLHRLRGRRATQWEK